MRNLKNRCGEAIVVAAVAVLAAAPFNGATAESAEFGAICEKRVNHVVLVGIDGLGAQNIPCLLQ